MRERPLGRAAQFEETRGEARPRSIVEECGVHEEAPRPSELVFEIGIALAGFLSVAVFANLIVVAIHAG